jgi:hypothetical protein
VLVKFCCDPDVLKLHVEDDRLISLGDVFELLPNKSDSFVAAIAKGLRATLPGVMLGSSSIFLIWVPYYKKICGKRRELDMYE